MNELQWSLVAVGALAVGGVYLFNRLQERNLRRHAEKTFRAPHADVLLGGGKGPGSGALRIDPSLAPEPELSGATEAELAPEAEPRSEPEPVFESENGLEEAVVLDDKIDYVAELQAEKAVSSQVLARSITRFQFTGHPVHWIGKTQERAEWHSPLRAAGQYSVLRAGLQLVDRGGPLLETELASFCGMIKNVAAELAMTARLPSEALALRAAAQLDEFCSQVDVSIGVNVVAGATPMAASAIRALAEKQGMTLDPDGVFRYRGRDVEPLFSLANQEPRPFMAAHIDGISTRALTFLLDVPRVRGSAKILDMMVALARHFAQALNARVVDDNGALLHDAGVAKIRAQLDEIATLMERRGIASGGALALRLFSE
jgi:hypothetical protein